MTFDPNIPNAGQSPGLFPPQNNTNFARLKTIINADHVFNDTAQSTDGFHRQCTLIARAQPGGLPAGSNSILYTWLDGSGQSQLRFYNGAADFQLTPLVNTGVTKVAGSVALAGNATSGTVWTIPTNTFAWVFVNYIAPAGNFFRLYYIYNSGGLVLGDVLRDSDNSSKPAINFSGANMRVVNGNSSARTVGYYVMAASI